MNGNGLIYTAPAVGTGVQAARGGQVLGIGGKNVLTAWQEEEVAGSEMTGELVHGSRQETARARSWLTFWRVIICAVQNWNKSLLCFFFFFIWQLHMAQVWLVFRQKWFDQGWVTVQQWLCYGKGIMYEKKPGGWHEMYLHGLRTILTFLQYSPCWHQTIWLYWDL